MTRFEPWPFLVLGLVAAASLFVRCECSCSSPPVEPTCSDVSDCVDREWGEVYCSEADGHWECLQGQCLAFCDVCTENEDCRPWARPTPADAGCDFGSGDWGCVDEACVWECPECVETPNCETYPWPADAGCDEADGFWECVEGACLTRCPGAQCETDPECAALLPWPTPEERPDLDCEEATGHWRCDDGTCSPHCNEQCNRTMDCNVREWTRDCQGHFDCVRGLCDEVCMDDVCGDGRCDDELGETQGSCPTDCYDRCTADADCLNARWDVLCEGTWDCAGGACVEVCDYATCGNGSCDADLGETFQTCRADCQGCGSYADCVGTEPWTLLCRGFWACIGGECTATCSSNLCGDGMCRPDFGEDGSSCFQDCGFGPCDVAADCLGADWREDCDGRWTCNAAGGCAPECDPVSCGDGTCDLEAGEAPASCPADCATYTCLTNPQCAGQTLPEGCEGGEWMCFDEVCRPMCP
jgi:hypothetical protein